MALFDRFKKSTDETVEDIKEMAADVMSGDGDIVDDVKEMAADVMDKGDDIVESIDDAAPAASPPGSYRKVRIRPGGKGWGVGFDVEPHDGKHLIYSVTGGGIHPVAQRIADLSGGVAFDGFKSKAAFEEIAVAVIDCGGTARIGVYPMKGVLTVDIHNASPSGPLMRFINEENFVSGVGVDEITVVDE